MSEAVENDIYFEQVDETEFSSLMTELVGSDFRIMCRRKDKSHFEISFKELVEEHLLLEIYDEVDLGLEEEVTLSFVYKKRKFFTKIKLEIHTGNEEDSESENVEASDAESSESEAELEDKYCIKFPFNLFQMKIKDSYNVTVPEGINISFILKKVENKSQGGAFRISKLDTGNAVIDVDQEFWDSVEPDFMISARLDLLNDFKKDINCKISEKIKGKSDEPPRITVRFLERSPAGDQEILKSLWDIHREIKNAEKRKQAEAEKKERDEAMKKEQEAKAKEEAEKKAQEESEKKKEAEAEAEAEENSKAENKSETPKESSESSEESKSEEKPDEGAA